jgi:hypothetical protein
MLSLDSSCTLSAVSHAEVGPSHDRLEALMTPVVLHCQQSWRHRIQCAVLSGQLPAQDLDDTISHLAPGPLTRGFGDRIAVRDTKELFNNRPDLYTTTCDFSRRLLHLPTRRRVTTPGQWGGPKRPINWTGHAALKLLDMTCQTGPRPRPASPPGARRRPD